MVELIDCQLRGGEKLNQNYAGFGVRLVAALIDGLIIFFIIMILSFMLGLVTGSDLASLGIWANVFQIALTFAYFVLYQSSAGQTLGKKVMKIKVVNESGTTPSVIVFFLREMIGKTVSSLIFGIGYLMVLWDGKKQGLHDKIANTYVVRVS